MAYIEIMRDMKGELWQEYKKVANYYPNLAMQQIGDLSSIWTVFRSLFEEKQKQKTY
jgi:uncharacterized sporulation protein YeaH/YhbH (DUF444 family)